ncbi:MAG: hypothetical protein K1X57_11455 [Gemmataceae bacterium]|nr:hypothetical protein [Gemmataceae bacterium]
MTPMPAGQVLDNYFLEARARLLDLAAILDRIDRGGGAADDPRRAKLAAGLDALLSVAGERAEKVQEIFSLPYDEGWQRPKPR